MTECPNLEYLKLNTIQGSELVQVEWNDQVDSAGRVESIENVVVAKDWTCLKLISLSIRIELTNEIVKSGLNDQLFHARCERRRQLESEHAFRQLSRLTRLEKLDISSCEAVSIQSLMLKLDQSGKGLQQLVSLKNLRKLAFEDTFQEMSEEDLDWMFENWPLLASLVGKLHILHGIDIELRKYINEEIRERIAKANAGTSLHTLVARMMVNLS
ncbi:hypothetical protein BGZ49_007222 [Haplosporangium sp. Z 27]|nr:hypothetical protein BGZ49_007222 [Haplosporangium sp. Z 27]